MSNLTGTTWKFNSTITLPSIFGATAEKPIFVCLVANQGIYCLGMGEQSTSLVYYGADGVDNTAYSSSWTDSGFRTITFIAEPENYMDTEQAFLTWLNENAERIDNIDYVVPKDNLTDIANSIRSKWEQSSIVDGKKFIINEYPASATAFDVRTYDMSKAFEINGIDFCGMKVTYSSGVPTITYYLATSGDEMDVFYNGKWNVEEFRTVQFENGAYSNFIEYDLFHTMRLITWFEKNAVQRLAFPDGFVNGIQNITTPYLSAITITPTDQEQVFTPSSGYNGFNMVTVYSASGGGASISEPFFITGFFEKAVLGTSTFVSGGSVNLTFNSWSPVANCFSFYGNGFFSTFNVTSSMASKYATLSVSVKFRTFQSVNVYFSSSLLGTLESNSTYTLNQVYLPSWYSTTSSTRYKYSRYFSIYNNNSTLLFTSSHSTTSSSVSGLSQYIPYFKTVG